MSCLVDTAAWAPNFHNSCSPFEYSHLELRCTIDPHLQGTRGVQKTRLRVAVPHKSLAQSEPFRIHIEAKTLYQTYI